MRGWAGLVLLGALLFAQPLPAQILKPWGQPSADAPAASADSFGRDTPSGTVFGFLQAAQAGDTKMAAEYLQMSAARRHSDGEEAAIQLKLVLDRAFVGSLKRISTQPDGDIQNGNSPDRQVVGNLAAGDIEAPLTLVRVTNPDGGKIWLFSSATLQKVPELADELQAKQIEPRLPRFLVRYHFLGIALWQWVGLLLAIPLAAGVGWLLLKALLFPVRAWRAYRKLPNLRATNAVSGPWWLLFGVAAHRVMMGYLGLPLLQRHYYSRVFSVVAVVAVFGILLRLSSAVITRLRNNAIAAGRTGTGSLALMGERLIKVALFIAAGLAVMGALGFNLTTALAGLGIGGLAVALAAQKTLENLFGGISVLSDEVIRVGDTCMIAGRLGVVEDISLRSTRIRTQERTELSIPNGALATMNVENFTRRDKVLFNPKLGLRYETSPDQLRFVLAEIRRMLYEHPKVESDSTRIRFASFDDSGLGLEVSSYVPTTDFAEFAAIREDLLFRIMEIVNASGTGFAFPSRTLYMGQDSGLDKAKSAVAEQQVEHWRNEKQLPFPDFAPEDIAEFRDSLAYPHPESARGQDPKNSR